jgi:hypothetical protein
LEGAAASEGAAVIGDTAPPMTGIVSEAARGQVVGPPEWSGS